MDFALSAKEIFSSFFNKASKHLGQNFLFDPNINRKVVSCAGMLDNKAIIEVGPGPGGLTVELLKHKIKILHLIEFDKHWAQTWRVLKNEYNLPINVIECDALTFDFNLIESDIIISNLPYNISTQLLFKWLPSLDKYEALVLMFQKEVAERLYASPKTKQYGKLSVISQSKAKITKAFDVASGAFSPPPKVTSTVVKLEPFALDYYYNSNAFCKLSELLTQSFAHRRKVLIKQLSKIYPNIQDIISSLGYINTVRAEEISVNDFVRILQLIDI